MPAVDPPAGARIDRAKFGGVLRSGGGVARGQTGGGGLFDEAGEEGDRAVGEVEVPAAGVGEEGDGAIGVRGHELEGGRETILPPLVLAHDHEGGDAGDASVAPFDAFVAVAGERGAGSVAFIGNEREGALRGPGGEVPREGGAGGVAERNDRSGRELGVSGGGGEAGHDSVEVLAGAGVEIEGGVEVGHDPELGEAQSSERPAHGRVLEDALLDHVVAGDDHAAHAFAVFRNPEVGARVAIGRGPLPDLGAQRAEPGGAEHEGEQAQDKTLRRQGHEGGPKTG